MSDPARSMPNNAGISGRNRRRNLRAIDSERIFERQQTPVVELPDPGPLLENLARCAVEAIAGARELDQVARWVDEEVFAHLSKRVVLAARARQFAKQPAVRPTLRVGTTVSCSPGPGIVEAAVVLHSRGRSRVVAIRLEGLDRRWRATAIHVL